MTWIFMFIHPFVTLWLRKLNLHEVFVCFVLFCSPTLFIFFEVLFHCSSKLGGTCVKDWSKVVWNTKKKKKKKTNVMEIFGLDILMLWAWMLDLKLDIISPYHSIIIITIVHKLLCKSLFACFLLLAKRN